jgi:hypothetical protein
MRKGDQKGAGEGSRLRARTKDVVGSLGGPTTEAADCPALQTLFIEGLAKGIECTPCFHVRSFPYEPLGAVLSV